MQIQLRQAEIEKALKAFVASQGISLTDKEVTIAFTSGRKDNGISADIIINDLPDAPAEEVPAPKQAPAINPVPTLKAAPEQEPAAVANPPDYVGIFQADPVNAITEPTVKPVSLFI